LAAPKTPREWSIQVALGALVVLVFGYFIPERRVFLIVLLVAMAIGSWIVMALRQRRHKDGDGGGE